MTTTDQTTAIATEIDQISADLTCLTRKMNGAANANGRKEWAAQLRDFADLLDRLAKAAESIGPSECNAYEVRKQLAIVTMEVYGSKAA